MTHQDKSTPRPCVNIAADVLRDALADGDGFWNSCSGCHETDEGVPRGAWDAVLQCHVGIGCGECGGLGAIWDTTDYAAMGAELSKKPAVNLHDAHRECVEALREAQIFLNVGASFAPNVAADVAFHQTNERFRSRGLADVMRQVAEEAGAALSRLAKAQGEK